MVYKKSVRWFTLDTITLTKSANGPMVPHRHGKKNVSIFFGIKFSDVIIISRKKNDKFGLGTRKASSSCIRLFLDRDFGLI